jgi:hypothetical protein
MVGAVLRALRQNADARPIAPSARMARTTLGAGLGLQVGRTRFDLGGGYVHEGERTVTNACNPTASMAGCLGNDQDRPVRQRTAPDPVQPGNGPLNQIESPFNAGTYEQRYVQLSLGATYQF